MDIRPSSAVNELTVVLQSVQQMIPDGVFVGSVVDWFHFEFGWPKDIDIAVAYDRPIDGAVVERGYFLGNKQRWQMGSYWCEMFIHPSGIPYEVNSLGLKLQTIDSRLAFLKWMIACPPHGLAAKIQRKAQSLLGMYQAASSDGF